MKYAIYLMAMLPLYWVIPEGFQAIDPYDKFLYLTGLWGTVWFSIVLLLGPIGRYTKKKELFYGKQPLGLATFTWFAVHVIAYFWFHQSSFDIALFDLVLRPFLVVGLVAFGILSALAYTSRQKAIKWLKAGWNQLHQMVVIAAALGAAHGLIAQKTTTTEGAVVAMVLLAALITRYKLMIWSKL